MKQLIPLVALAALTTTANADKKQYSLADLKALVGQKSFKEAVEHLQDVSPSERNADWLAVAGDAAAGYIAGLNNDDLVKKILEIERLDGEIPAILKSPKYSKARADIGLKGFDACFGYSYAYKECFDHAIKFVEADAANADLALKMAKLVRRNSSPHASATGFFKRAINAAGKNGAAICKDEDLKMAVVSSFNLPDHYEDAQSGRHIVINTCWNDFKQVVQGEFKKASETSYERRNTCKILEAQKAMTGDQPRQCKEAFKDS
jgi:hypothetical protein